MGNSFTESDNLMDHEIALANPRPGYEAFEGEGQRLGGREQLQVPSNNSNFEPAGGSGMAAGGGGNAWNQGGYGSPEERLGRFSGTGMRLGGGEDRLNNSQGGSRN